MAHEEGPGRPVLYCCPEATGDVKPPGTRTLADLIEIDAMLLFTTPRRTPSIFGCLSIWELREKRGAGGAGRRTAT
jgi:hypothetical protein